MVDNDDIIKQLEYYKLFDRAYAEKRIKLIRNPDAKFVHYTSAEAFLNIVKNREFWMRKTQCMNDYSEFKHSLQQTIQSLKNGIDQKIKSASDEIFPGAFDDAFRKLMLQIPEIEENTFIACLSEHARDEDHQGRLSMWRAYSRGTGVAIVMNKEPFSGIDDSLKAYSTPISYSTPQQLNDEIIHLLNNLNNNKEAIQEQGKDMLASSLFLRFKNMILSLKHPGFREEREWRIFYNPTIEESPYINIDIECIDGIVQQVAKIQTVKKRKDGTDGTSLDTLIHEVIIGPTQYPSIIKEALSRVLEDAEVSKPADRISISNIPLRT
jgi:hypothetical protein